MATWKNQNKNMSTKHVYTILIKYVLTRKCYPNTHTHTLIYISISISLSIYISSSSSSSLVLLAWISLTLSNAIYLYHPSLPAGLLECILCPYRAVEDKLVVQHLHVCVKGFIEECCLWVCALLSISVSHVFFVLFGWF